MAFQASATDPEGSVLSPYWTVTGGSQSGTRSGAAVAFGAAMGDQFTFRTFVVGVYTVYLTVYDNLGLFDECRWVIDVQPNARPKIDVISGRTSVEFGRLDEVRQVGAGPIVSALTAMRPGVAAPVTVPAQTTSGGAVAWSGLSLCPTGVPGPYGPLPEAESVIRCALAGGRAGGDRSSGGYGYYLCAESIRASPVSMRWWPMRTAIS